MGSVMIRCLNAGRAVSTAIVTEPSVFRPPVRAKRGPVTGSAREPGIQIQAHRYINI